MVIAGETTDIKHWYSTVPTPGFQDHTGALAQIVGWRNGTVLSFHGELSGQLVFGAGVRSNKYAAVIVISGMVPTPCRIWV